MIQAVTVDNLDFNPNSNTNPTTYPKPYIHSPFVIMEDWSRYSSGPCKALFHTGSGGYNRTGFTISCSGVIVDGSLWNCNKAKEMNVRGRIRYVAIGLV